MSTFDISYHIRAIDNFSATAHKVDEAVKRTSANIKKSSKAMNEWGKAGMARITLPFVALAGASVKLATDMEETINKIDVVFEENAQQVKDWASTSIKSMGMAQQTALDNASIYGDMATAMGLNNDESTKMSTSIVQLSADLASFKNISADRANTALKGIFTGETEALKGLGIVMTQDTLNMYALSKGMNKTIKDMTQAEKVQLRYNFVMDSTTKAHGDFVRTGGGSANQMRMFQENLKELGVLFGQVLLPAFTKFITKLNDALIKFQQMSPASRKMILIFGGILAVIPALVFFIAQFGIAIATLMPIMSGLHLLISGKMIPVILKFGLALMANPIALIVVAVVALGVAIYQLWKNWETVVAFFNENPIGMAIKKGVEIAMLPLQRMIDLIKTAIQYVGKLQFVQSGIGKVKGLFKKRKDEDGVGGQGLSSNAETSNKLNQSITVVAPEGSTAKVTSEGDNLDVGLNMGGR